MWWLVVAHERQDKQGRVMNALNRGMGTETQVCVDAPPTEDPFVACGQTWIVERIVPPAIEAEKPFWLIDNGYYLSSGKGRAFSGHYEMTYRGLVPILMNDPDYSRFPAKDVLEPWRTSRKGAVLLALPGMTFGRMIGMDMFAWAAGIQARIRSFTDRPIIVRPKHAPRPLSMDLARCSVVVTHSSNVAVDAVRMGVPAIVARSNPAAPVCSTNLKDIDNPPMPDRRQWWASLMSQQYTLEEMQNGTAWRFMKKVMEQTDG